MEVIKAFNNNKLHTNIVINGTREEPLFRASDIGEVLGMSNIRATIMNFDNTERHDVNTIDIIGRTQNTTFLTEKGLYKILFKSRKPIAEQFQNWVCEVIKELRLQGTYTIQKQLEKQQEEIKQKEEEMKKQQEELKKKEEEIKKLQETKGKLPMIYIYNTDVTQKNSPLKIGMSNSINERTKPFRQTHPNGKIVFKHEIPGDNVNLQTFEKFIHTKLKDFRIQGEVFRIDQEEAIISIMTDVMLYNLYTNTNDIERQQKMREIYESVKSIIHKIPKSTNEIACQTEEAELEQITIQPQPNENPQIAMIEKFIREHCIVRSDVEISGRKISGLFRVLNKNKKREVSDALNNYLKTHFKYGKLKIQDKNQLVLGYSGITIIEPEYKKGLITCDEETFVFEQCIFTPEGTLSYKELLEDYIFWKTSLQKEITGEENKTLKKYLDGLPYVMYDTVNTSEHGSCQGYYGLSNKKHIRTERKNISTAKTIEKRDIHGNVLCVFESIAKTADSEKMCTAKMSRSVKDRRIFTTLSGEQYYYAIKGTT